MNRLRDFTAGLALGLALALLAPVDAQESGVVPARPATTANGTVAQAVLFGDSLAVAAAPHWWHQFAPVTTTTWSAQRGWSLASWEPQITPLLAAQGTAPVVLALGTNDAYAAGQLPVWRRVLDRLLLTRRCVVVPDLARPDAVRQAWWAQLEPVLRSYPNVRVAAWWETARLHPEFYGPDGVHHTAVGDVAYSWSLWLGVQGCLR